jgi:hypothetical protein
MVPTTINVPVIRYIVAPTHTHEGELVRSRMTRKLETDQASEDVRRAINAWLYEETPIHNSNDQSNEATQ